MIRQLRPGELLPDGEPRRYVGGHGYVRLRWHVGRREYVETYEHRVDGDRVTTADHVHHRNHDRADNRPENLEVLTADEHLQIHTAERKSDDVLLCTLYMGGFTSTQVARLVGCNAATVSRVLARNRVPARRQLDYAPKVDADELRRLYASGLRVPGIAAALGVPDPTVRRVMRELDLPSFPQGRPPNAVIPCQLCGSPISPGADCCPKCGELQG